MATTHTNHSHSCSGSVLLPNIFLFFKKKNSKPREALGNGTLVVYAFSPAQYRSDVHAAVYRCRVGSARGVLLSRDTRLEAVMDVAWELRAAPTPGVARGAALVACSAPAAVRDHVVVTTWRRDGAVLSPLAAEAEGRYIIGGSRNDVLVVRDVRPDDTSSYSCEAQHALTGEKRTSPAVMLAVSHATGSMSPRMLTVSDEDTVPQGGDIRLVCCALGSPPPTYNWFRRTNGRVMPVSNSIRISVSEQVLIIRRAQLSDAGVWTCRAHNQYGEQRKDSRLRVQSKLVVTVHPQLQVANSGSSVAFNCSVEGGEARVRWLHDGVPVGGGERVLRVHGVVRAHRGMYQCFAERDLDAAQASAELWLGDTVPELQYTFIEQALHPGPALALHCAASGSPPPRIAWLLDGQPLDERSTAHRSISQFMGPNGDVVSYLNLTSVRPEDGGRYSCRATNSRGIAEHSTRLNVYGPPSIRSAGPVRAVAGLNTTIYCPYSGFPISSIRWQRGGLDLSSTGGRTLAGMSGELLLWPAEPSDAGVYSCKVTAPTGQYAQKDIQIFVRNPPKIAGFSFPMDLVEGSSVQVLCGITSGDKPVYFSWLKDGQHIPSNLQVQEKSLDEFSFLIFSRVSSEHSGEYTCVAGNSAAEVSHTARLAVKVAPSWLLEPQDISALLDTQITIHCATKGYPEPRIYWLKVHGTNNDFEPVSNLELQMLVLANGTLSVAAAGRRHEGRYMCRAENGVGRGLSKIITISVNEPAHFEFSSRNMTVKRSSQAVLQCDARGDPPLQLQWTHNTNRVDLTPYRVSVSEKRSESGVISQLTIAHAERLDSGLYRCRAENAYGRDELLIYLAVQELPEAPRGLQAAARAGRGAVLRWRSGFDGNAQLRGHRLQLRVVAEPAGSHALDWTDAPSREVPPDKILRRQDVFEASSEKILEYRVEGLRPATAYALRLAAVNDIGESDYSEPIIVQTLEEAPSDPPLNVHAQATAPGEVLVKWQPPPQESWNGELLGYAVTWQETGGVGTSVGGTESLVLTVPGWGASRATAAPLRPRTHYEIQVRAYNALGAGPPCNALTVTTPEAAPEAAPDRARCEPLSAQSLRVWWEPPPLASRGGLVLGYDLNYETVEGWKLQKEVHRTAGLEAVLTALRRATRYCVRVSARSTAGAGPPAEPVCCTTHEDVPGAPADIKVVANSEDTVIVSWLEPAEKNGKIKHYTVYSRLQRTGQRSQLSVARQEGAREHEAAVRGLREGQLYEFWVTATTAAGEGEMSAVVALKPNARAPAKLTSFGGTIMARAGDEVRLRCGAAGAPPPHRVFSRRAPLVPLTLQQDPRFLLEGNTLLIVSAEEDLADNYTCSVRNPWGEDSTSWQLMVSAAPAAPVLRLAASHPATLRVAWDAPSPASQLHGFILEHALETESSWTSRRLPADARAHAIAGLACGTAYRVRLMAFNAAGTSAPSEELHVSTKGGRPKAPSEKDLFTSNSTCLRLNLLAWESNGCPLAQVTASARAFEQAAWRSATWSPLQPAALCGLRPGAWHHLALLVRGAAGVASADYYFATLTQRGERVPAPASFPPRGSAGDGGSSGHADRGVLLVAAISALAFILLLIIGLVYTKSWSPTCFRKEYEQSDVSEEEKSVEKRDNHRNCQQVYTSSPIKNTTGKKDQQEMYEISPYATFSMSGGASAVEAGGEGCTLHTFGRGEPAPLLAAPAPAPPRPGRHRDRTSTEDYVLSRGMTLAVRRSESESESSGSGSGSGSACGECAAAAYRTPVAAAKAEKSIPSANSGSVDDCSGCTGDARPSGRRRRARRHVAAPHTRYQQRQEQERRDFTIHV